MERGDYFSSSGLLYHFWIWHVARNLSFLATFWKHLAITAHQGVWVSDWRYYFSPLHWAIPCLFVQDLICIASPNLVKRKISLCQQIVICTYKRFPSHIAFQNVNLSVWKKVSYRFYAVDGFIGKLELPFKVWRKFQLPRQFYIGVSLEYFFTSIWRNITA